MLRCIENNTNKKPLSSYVCFLYGFKPRRCIIHPHENPQRMGGKIVVVVVFFLLVVHWI